MARMGQEEDRKLLETFVLDNAELEQLESQVNPLNIFEAVGLVDQEIRHSHFLAYLLDPQQNHGLGSALVRKFVQRAVSRASDPLLPITLIDLDTWDLEQLQVITEWKKIDVLLRDDSNRFVVVIENKIGTSEHSDQLKRYWKTVEEHYPAYKKIGIYLTPDCDLPSCDRFITMGYGDVATVLDKVSKGGVSPSALTYAL